MALPEDHLYDKIHEVELKACSIVLFCANLWLLEIAYCVYSIHFKQRFIKEIFLVHEEFTLIMNFLCTNHSTLYVVSTKYFTSVNVLYA